MKSCSLALAAALLAALVVGEAQAKLASHTPQPPQVPAQVPSPGHAGTPPQKPATAAETSPAVSGFITHVALADLGFANGLRLVDLGERRNVFIPLPECADIAADELSLTLDDFSAYDARRSLEVLANDRTVAALALDGHATGRVVHVKLADAHPNQGFLKLTFVYSGAATQDRCVDVRTLADSLTIRPESAVTFNVAFAGAPDVATTAALLPRQVTLVLPHRALTPADVETALTLARALTASGRQITVQSGFDGPHEAAKEEAPRAWTQGFVFIGSLDEVSGLLEAPLATVAGALPNFGTLAAARIGGFPALIVSDVGAGRAARLFATPGLAAMRGISAARVGEAALPSLPTDRVSFAQLGIAPPPVDVFDHDEITLALATRKLPPKTVPARIDLDVMVAPDPNGEEAVVSAYVNDSMLASTVALNGEPTRLPLVLPDAIVGSVANLRLVIQRRAEHGDCKYEQQGFPVQILGTSDVVLKPAGAAHGFADLTPQWGSGIEVIIARAVLDHPEAAVAFLNDTVSALSAETAPVAVKIVSNDTAPAPDTLFLAVGTVMPQNAVPNVRFDRGRVTVADQSGHTLLDLAGLTSGAVAQVVSSGTASGLWVKPIESSGALPAPAKLVLDHGNVVFIDQAGVALALSTEREKLARIVYPDQVSWLSIAAEFRPWITGGVWFLATLIFLFILQRVLRRPPRSPGA